MKTPEEITIWCDMMLNHHPNIEDTNFFNSIKDYMKKQRQPLVTNAEEAEAYPINQEENCKIVREFLRDVINVKNLPVCKECSTCEHCKKKYNKLLEIIWMNDCPFIFCTHHQEHFAPNDTCEFWKGGGECVTI